jgi:hypothetical protein
VTTEEKNRLILLLTRFHKEQEDALAKRILGTMSDSLAVKCHDRGRENLEKLNFTIRWVKAVH